MVDTSLTNGLPAAPVAQQLPEVLVLVRQDFQRLPSPGTMRDLKAQTGRSYDELCGPDADRADQFQTVIWVKLRRLFPGLRWDDCAEIAPEINQEDLADLDPTRLAGFEVSPPSVGSGD